MRTPRAALRVIISLMSLAPLAWTQDSHYWTNQYGTRATLLGGAVIGSVLDLSGTYYNPGGMSLIEKPHTLMAANVFQYPRVLLRGNRSRKHPPQQVQPQAGARSCWPGPFASAVSGITWFGYSYVARQAVKLGISSSPAGVHDVLPDMPGSEDYVTQFRLDEKLSESWFGLTWSTKLSKHIGIGVTQYIAYRSHRAITQELVEALSQENRLAAALGERQYSYYHFRALWKIGLACDFETITLGLTLTSPSLAIAGRGSTGVNSTLTGLDMDGDGASEDFLASDYHRRLPVTYETPLSLAAGMTFKIQKVRLYWSTEWFARVRPYTVVDAAPFVAQSTGEVLSTDVTQELSAVLNWGVGLEWFYSQRFKGYASFTTDDSAKKPGTSTNISLTDWDIHHIVTGGEFIIKKSSVTVGLGFSFGGREIGERPDIIARSVLEGVWDPFGSLKFRYNCYKLIFGFAI